MKKIWRVEVYNQKREYDGKAKKEFYNLKNQFPIESLRTSKLYYLDALFKQPEVDLVAKSLFYDPITEQYKIDEEAYSDFDWFIEIRFRKGVTDNEGNAAKKGIEGILNCKCLKYLEVSTGEGFALKGNLTEEQVKQIAQLYSNSFVQYYDIKRLR